MKRSKTTESPTNNLSEANRRVYQGGSATHDYLALPYHRLRIELATKRLFELWKQRNPRETNAPVFLDLGAGSGEASQLLRKHGARVIAVDFDKQSLERAKGKSDEQLQVDLTLYRLPFKDKSLDGIYAGELIEHFFDPVALLSECRRILKPSGALVLSTPNLATLQDRLKFLGGKSPRQVNPNHPYLKLHIRPLTVGTIKETLQNAGLSAVDLSSNYLTWSIGKKDFMSSRAAKLLPRFGGSLIISAVPENSLETGKNLTTSSLPPLTLNGVGMSGDSAGAS